MDTYYDLVKDNSELRKTLFNSAKLAKEHAYAPYSNFHVGAALLTDGEAVYHGANIENASYGATTCAERVAINAAVMDGHRNFTAIAIAGDNEETLPCGICRQCLAEFADGNMAVITGPDTVYRLSELLPYAFAIEDRSK